MTKENEYVDYGKNLFELGGFAEVPSDIDGDFEYFNICLADEYISAMISEDFNALGELSRNLIETIYNWAGLDVLKNISRTDFYDGSFLTYKNRTFIEAITKTHAYQAGEAYLHVSNPKFLAMMVAYAELYEYDLGYQFHEQLNNDEYNRLIQDTLVELNNIYESIDNEEKIELLQRVKKTLSNIRVPKGFSPCKIPRNALTKKLLMEN